MSRTSEKLLMIMALFPLLLMLLRTGQAKSAPSQKCDFPLLVHEGQNLPNIV